jgi:uncharacterized protein YbjT (DUF2867 family)
LHIVFSKSGRFQVILVTGASGTVGSALVGQLLAKGQAVRVFTRDAAKVTQWGTQVECAVGDLSQPETLGAALQGVARVFLVTGATQQDVNAIQAAQRAGVQQLVKLSTIEAGHEPMIGHGKFHREREELIRASGLAWTFLRPTMFMSTALDWADAVRQQGLVRYPGGEGQVAAVHPADVAAVAAEALTGPGHAAQAYALTGRELLTMGDMALAIGRAIGKPVAYADMPEAEAGEMMLKAGLPAYAVAGLTEAFTAMRSGRFAYVTDAVQRVTGCPPRTFDTWCQEHVAAFQ